MAPPILALRFRDTTPGISTIEAHIDLIRAFGEVWWGWWKKEAEDRQYDVLARLISREAPTSLLLIDRSTKRMWLATCVNWATDRQHINLELVPEYYRQHVGDVAAFFNLKDIVETNYDAEIGERIGERTFLEIGAVTKRQSEILAAPAIAQGKSSILHLSDLHFGADYGFRLQDKAAKIGDSRATLTECLVEDLGRIGRLDDIAAVIITGDFISAGDWNDEVRKAALAEFSALRSSLGITRDQILAVPGNHDIVRYSTSRPADVADQSVQRQTNQQHEREFRTFVDELIGRNWKETLNYVRRVRLHEADVIVCVLNSCTITSTEWTEYGYVGVNGIDAIRELGVQSIDRPTFKFLALHHHLLPVADIEVPNAKGVSLTLDASRLLEEAQRAGVHVAIHGHQHIPKIARYQNVSLMGEPDLPALHIIANGSSGAKQARLPLNERNTYCLFRLTAPGVELYMRELRSDARAGATIYKGSLNLNAIVP